MPFPSGRSLPSPIFFLNHYTLLIGKEKLYGALGEIKLLIALQSVRSLT